MKQQDPADQISFTEDMEEAASSSALTGKSSTCRDTTKTQKEVKVTPIT